MLLALESSQGRALWSLWMCPLSGFTHDCSLLTHTVCTWIHRNSHWLTHRRTVKNVAQQLAIIHRVAYFCVCVRACVRVSVKRYAAEHSLLYCAGWNTVFHSVSTRWEDCVLHSHHQSSVCSNTKRESLFLFFILFVANQKSDPLLPCPLVTHVLNLCSSFCGCPLWLLHW